MKKYTLWYLLLSLITITKTLNAHAFIDTRTANVTIVLNDNAYRQGLTVSFQIYQNDINTNMAGFNSYCTFKLTNRITKCKIALSTKLNYGRIVLFNPSLSFKDWDMPLDHGNNLFIFENGDDVKIVLGTHKSQATFEGKSAVKFKCLFELSNMKYDEGFSKNYNYYFSKNDPKGALNSIKEFCDSLYKVKLAKLGTYALDPQVRELVKLDLWAESVDIAIGTAFYAFRSKNKAWFPESKNFFRAHYDQDFELPKVSEELIAKSYKTGDCLANREYGSAIVANSTDTSSYYNRVDYSNIWEQINRHYKPGLIKDKVVLMSFVAVLRNRQGDFVNFTKQAFENAESSNIKNALQKIDAVNKSGAEAFPFKLEDNKGNLVTLSDLKGKVVVLDFWFTGCMACLQLAKVLKPLVEESKLNPNVVFVSISVDRNRSVWLQSLKEGKYTSDDEINLLAENGWQSKIVQYYNINGFPTLLVISKEGKIISTTPPNPKYRLKEFKDLLIDNF